MDKLYLIKYGEIWVKGKNRYMFEDKLVSNISKRIKEFGEFKVYKKQNRIFVEVIDLYDYNVDLIEQMCNIFGIIGIAEVTRLKDKNIDKIKEISKKHIDQISDGKKISFKVEAKRADKSFPLKSPDIAKEVGGYIYESSEKYSVDVKNPDVLLWVEVREDVFIYSKVYKGIGGMPIGTNGKGLLMLSGGIDSPVAGWMIAKRGVSVDAIYFDSPPYTSLRARKKVEELTSKLSKYIDNINLYVVPFTDLQLHMKEKCKMEYITIIMRRAMLKICEKFSEMKGYNAIVTGESIGQVASQTIYNLNLTNSSVAMPIFRPLIGFDKDEIIEKAQKINTYETSILPYDDCCTLFLAKHPATKVPMEKIIEDEKNMDKYDELIDNIVNNIEKVKITN